MIEYKSNMQPVEKNANPTNRWRKRLACAATYIDSRKMSESRIYRIKG